MSPAKFPKRNYEPRARRTQRPDAAPEQRPERGDQPLRPERGERPRRGERPLRAERRESLQRPERVYDEPVFKIGQRGKPADARPAAETSWERQAGWYDNLIGATGDDFYRELVLPVALRQLAARRSDRVLDVCCGQGVLGRVLAEKGIVSVGVDASPTLIKAAKSRAKPEETYVLGDARELDKVLAGERFDHAALIMAIQDVDPLQPVLSGVAALVKPGGRVVVVMTHPCFRIPKRATWGFDEETGVQFRRLEGYLSPLKLPIKTHPGIPADSGSTTSFHRPLSTILNAFGVAGLAVTACEELCSNRRGTEGPRATAEDRAAKEFPVFLALTAVRLGQPTGRETSQG